MTVEELDAYFKSILAIENLEKTDSSMNGIQVGEKPAAVEKIAFAVDACMQTFEAAHAVGADCLVVHHGLFWGKPLPISGTHYARVKYCIEKKMALYAVHLPLDMHPEFGNNAALAEMIGLEGLSEFGRHRGNAIGWKGTLPAPLSMDGVLKAIGLTREECLSILPFGPEKIASAAVISGGASHEIAEAVDEGVDLYLTGEASHVMYHQALEGRINLIAGGHYNTEIWGVKLLAEKCAADTGAQTVFIDGPTGL